MPKAKKKVPVGDKLNALELYYANKGTTLVNFKMPNFLRDWLIENGQRPGYFSKRVVIHEIKRLIGKEQAGTLKEEDFKAYETMEGVRVRNVDPDKRKK